MTDPITRYIASGGLLAHEAAGVYANAPRGAYLWRQLREYMLESAGTYGTELPPCQEDRDWMRLAAVLERLPELMPAEEGGSPEEQRIHDAVARFHERYLSSLPSLTVVHRRLGRTAASHYRHVLEGLEGSDDDYASVDFAADRNAMQWSAERLQLYVRVAECFSLDLAERLDACEQAERDFNERRREAAADSAARTACLRGMVRKRVQFWLPRTKEHDRWRREFSAGPAMISLVLTAKRLVDVHLPPGGKRFIQKRPIGPLTMADAYRNMHALLVFLAECRPKREGEAPSAVSLFFAPRSKKREAGQQP